MDNRNFNGKEGKEIVPIMEEIINSGGQCKLRVTGYSMTPILKHLSKEKQGSMSFTEF